MCATDYEPIEIFQDNDRKAKKLHRCSECFRLIQVGETYNYKAGISDRDFQAYKTCQHCDAGPTRLLIGKCRSYVFEGVMEDLGEHIHINGWGYRAARFYVGMKRQWKNFRGDGLMPVPAPKQEKEPN